MIRVIRGWFLWLPASFRSAAFTAMKVKAMAAAAQKTDKRVGSFPHRGAAHQPTAAPITRATTGMK
jgi:hypothetical protein